MEKLPFNSYKGKISLRYEVFDFDKQCFLTNIFWTVIVFGRKLQTRKATMRKILNFNSY